jgi:hypothetical protein
LTFTLLLLLAKKHGHNRGQTQPHESVTFSVADDNLKQLIAIREPFYAKRDVERSQCLLDYMIANDSVSTTGHKINVSPPSCCKILG